VFIEHSPRKRRLTGAQTSPSRLDFLAGGCAAILIRSSAALARLRGIVQDDTLVCRRALAATVQTWGATLREAKRSGVRLRLLPNDAVSTWHRLSNAAWKSWTPPTIIGCASTA
jgi:hypothetical protein